MNGYQFNFSASTGEVHCTCGWATRVPPFETVGAGYDHMERVHPEDAEAERNRHSRNAQGPLGKLWDLLRGIDRYPRPE